MSLWTHQLLMLKPVMQFAIWMITSFPRLCILLVSLCQTYAKQICQSCRLVRRRDKAALLTPAVEVFMPVPMPATTLPTIIYQGVRMSLSESRICLDHLCNTPRSSLYDSTNCDDSGPKEDLPWSSQPVASEDGTQSTREAA